MIDAREPTRNYKIPAVGNTVAEEFPRVGDAVTAIANDVASLLTSVAGRALLSHTHTIANVTGLQTALDSKHPDTWRPSLDDLTDVNAPSPTSGQVLMRVGSAWQPAPIANLDASVITTGTIDPARIPVLNGQAPVVSSGGLADLTAPQQAAIITGTIVITTDGIRRVYSGSGSKTLSASYILLADATPEWAEIANKPSAFAPSAHGHAIPDITGLQTALDGKSANGHGHAITDVSGLQAALDGKASLAANTLTGDQTISKASPQHILNKAASGQFSLLRGRTNGNQRWDIALGDDTPESGANAGSNFAVVSYNDAGAGATTRMRIVRDNGYTNLFGFTEIGIPNSLHALYVRRQQDVALVGGVLLLEGTPTTALNSGLLVRQAVNGLQIMEAGGSLRGLYLDVASCGAGVSSVMIHSGNLGSQLAAVAYTDVGSFGFFRDITGGSFNVGVNVAGSNLFWASAGLQSGIATFGNGGSPSGTWRRHGDSTAAYDAQQRYTLFQRVA